MPFLFSILVLIIIMGFVYWIVSVMPIPEPFKTIGLAIVLVICLLYLLFIVFGMAPAFPIFRPGYRY